MFSIRVSDLPADALLGAYAETPGCYSDCYTTDVGGTIDLSEFVAAFYTTRLFRLERFILERIASIPSTDDQARQLAEWEIEHFSAWKVENRTEWQLLVRDLSGRTRSWFMVEPSPVDGLGTRLYFGSAVVPKMNRTTKRMELGFVFKALLMFHKLYSRALLLSAAARLGNQDENAAGRDR